MNERPRISLNPARLLNSGLNALADTIYNCELRVVAPITALGTAALGAYCMRYGAQVLDTAFPVGLLLMDFGLMNIDIGLKTASRILHLSHPTPKQPPPTV